MFSMTIEVNPKSEFAKSRRFSADCLCYVTADHLWETGGNAGDSKDRPVYAVFVGKETTLRPFIANLRLGRKAQQTDRGSRKFEFLKSVPYVYSWQRFQDGNAAITVFLPELFVLDPGMIDPSWCQFVSLVPTWWANQLLDYLPQREIDAVQAHATKLGVQRDVKNEVASAAHFARLLDKRTRLPLVNSLAFSWQLYDRAVAEMERRSRSSYSYDWAYGCKDAGFEGDPMRFAMHHDTLDEFLRDEVKKFREVTNG